VIGQEWTNSDQQKPDKYKYAVLTKGMHTQAVLAAEDWPTQADIDLKQLKDRIFYCKKNWPKIKELFKD